MVEAILKRVRTGVFNTIAFEIPHQKLDIFKAEYKTLPEFVLVKIAKPRAKRSTGAQSQNHHIWGHVKQIAEYTGHDPIDVHIEAKERAIKRGYPCDILPNGWGTPKSESEINTVEAGYLIEELHQIAAELGVILDES